MTFSNFLTYLIPGELNLNKHIAYTKKVCSFPLYVDNKLYVSCVKMIKESTVKIKHLSEMDPELRLHVKSIAKVSDHSILKTSQQFNGVMENQDCTGLCKANTV